MTQQKEQNWLLGKHKERLKEENSKYRKKFIRNTNVDQVFKCSPPKVIEQDIEKYHTDLNNWKQVRDIFIENLMDTVRTNFEDGVK